MYIYIYIISVYVCVCIYIYDMYIIGSLHALVGSDS